LDTKQTLWLLVNCVQNEATPPNETKMDECEPEIYALCVRVGTFDGGGVHRAVMAPTRAFDDYVRRAGDELSPPLTLCPMRITQYAICF
jgi:hypothetical protein